MIPGSLYINSFMFGPSHILWWFGFSGGSFFISSGAMCRYCPVKRFSPWFTWSVTTTPRNVSYYFIYAIPDIASRILIFRMAFRIGCIDGTDLQLLQSPQWPWNTHIVFYPFWHGYLQCRYWFLLGILFFYITTGIVLPGAAWYDWQSAVVW